MISGGASQLDTFMQKLFVKFRVINICYADSSEHDVNCPKRSNEPEFHPPKTFNQIRLVIK